LNLFLSIYIVLNKTEKFTGPNKVLLVLERRTGAHCEDCHLSTYLDILLLFLFNLLCTFGNGLVL
jgi:hypothetical protein